MGFAAQPGHACGLVVGGQFGRLAVERVDLGADRGVRQSFVTVDDGAGGEKSLVAFVVSDTAGCTAQAIRDQLRARLPAYMIPARISFRESLPLSATGKVDRHALMSDLHARSEFHEHQ